MPAYRWATLGCGVIGNELAQAMQALGGNLYSVGNRTHEKALSFAEKYGIAKVYDKPEDIFSDPDVDIVYISTPHNTHIRYLLPALAADNGYAKNPLPSTAWNWTRPGAVLMNTASSWPKP